jgi:hypothetical protein
MYTSIFISFYLRSALDSEDLQSRRDVINSLKEYRFSYLYAYTYILLFFFFNILTYIYLLYTCTYLCTKIHILILTFMKLEIYHSKCRKR